MNGGKSTSSREIAEVLRERIRTGDLKKGDRLPTQAGLAEEFGVERGAVRKALRELQEDGLLSNVSKGSPPRVAEPPAPRQAPQPTLVALAPRLESAFAARQVRIDAVCLTAETLVLAMYAPLRLIEEGRIRPESVTARIVLPTKHLKLLYPAPVDGWGFDEAVDEAVHRRSMEQHVSHITVLRQHFHRLKWGLKIPASVHFRTVDNTPYQKVYLLNESEVLFAHYTAEKQEMDVGGVPMELWDAWGTQSLLFSFHAQNGKRDELFIAESQKWFNGLWEMLGSDLREP